MLILKSNLPRTTSVHPNDAGKVTSRCRGIRARVAEPNRQEGPNSGLPLLTRGLLTPAHHFGLAIAK